MRGLLCVGLLLAVGCDVVRERSAASTTTAATATEMAPALPDAPKPPDPFAKDYERAAAILRNWEGDERELESARAILGSILQKDPNYAPAYVGMARLEAHGAPASPPEARDEQLIRAAKFASHAVSLDANSSDAYLALATIAIQQKDFKRAHDAIAVAEGLNRDDLQIKLGRAQLASAEADTAQMLRQAQDVLAKSKDPSQRAEAYSYVVDAYESAGHSEGAETAYRQMIRLEPNSARIRSSYSRFLLRRGDPDGAIREGEEAVRLAQNRETIDALATASVAKAEQLWSAGRTAEAVDGLERFTSRFLDSAPANFGAAGFYERLFRRTADVQWRDRALSRYRRVLALDRGNREAAAGVERLTRG